MLEIQSWKKYLWTWPSSPHCRGAGLVGRKTVNKTVNKTVKGLGGELSEKKNSGALSDSGRGTCSRMEGIRETLSRGELRQKPEE